MNLSHIFRALVDDLIRCSKEEVEFYESGIDFYKDEIIQAKEAIVAFTSPYSDEQQIANIKLLMDEIDYLAGAALLLGEDTSIGSYGKCDEIQCADAKKTLIDYVELLIDNAPEADCTWSAYIAKRPHGVGNIRRHLL